MKTCARPGTRKTHGVLVWKSELPFQIKEMVTGNAKKYNRAGTPKAVCRHPNLFRAFAGGGSQSLACYGK